MKPSRSPDASSGVTTSPLALRSPRVSPSSGNTRQYADKGALAQTLEHIHATASRSESLTTFNDFASPPRDSFGIDGRPLTGSSQGGLGAFYTRLKASVSGVAESSPYSSSNVSSSNRTLRPNPSKGGRPETPLAISKDGFEAIPGSETVSSSSLSGKSPHESRVDKRLQVFDPAIVGLNPNTSDIESLGGEHQGTEPVVGGHSKLQHPDTSNETTNAARTSLDNHHDSFSPTVPRMVLNDYSKTDFPPSEAKLNTEDNLSFNAKNGTNAPTMPDSSSSTLKHGPVGEGSSKPQLPTEGLSLHSPSETDFSQRSGAVTFSDSSGPGKIRIPISQRLQDSSAPSQLAHRNTSADTAHPRGFMSQMRRSVLGKELWMRDENAKVCFNCGDSFSTFRRKHHCRTCGQIYDAKCTVLIPGKLLNQPGKLRVCKTCENIINGDDSSDYSEPDEAPATPQTRQIRFSAVAEEVDAVSRIDSSDEQDLRRPSPPEIASSLARRTWEGRRKSITILASDQQTGLPRPGSSRSLKSLSRNRSISQKHRRSRSQHMRSLGIVLDDQAPFQVSTASDQGRTPWGADSIIDPDLAPFVSDEGSSEDEAGSIATNLHIETPVSMDAGFASLFGAFKRSRLNPLAGNTLESIQISKDGDNNSIASSKQTSRRRPAGARILSTGSIGRYGSAIRPTRSENTNAMSNTLETMILEEKGVDARRNDALRRPAGKLHRGVTYDHTATSSELSDTSLRHVGKLLRQFLKDASVDTPKRWEKALMPILLRCAQDVEPNIHSNDDIDIRHYIKLKRAPGGSPTDSQYVSGVVFSKNVALKDMPRRIKNARILLISFPIVYARRQVHFMSLEPIIAQEREYLRNLVNRILLLKPDVLLVQQNVSGLALQFLQEARVSVAQNVKNSTLQAISRCTQTRIISSVEKLNMHPGQLGFCGAFEIKTILYRGIKKSYVYISGCQKDLGCTIVLRGAGLKTLSKLKWITEFMCYVAYNLKLETCLLRDEFVATPSVPDTEQPQSTEEAVKTSEALRVNDMQKPLSAPGDSPKVGSTMVSAYDTEEIDIIQQGTNTATQDLGPIPSNSKRVDVKDIYDKTVRDLRKRYLSVSPFVQLAIPYLLERVRDQEAQLNHLQTLLEQDDVNPCDEKDTLLSHNFQLVRPEMVYSNAYNANTQVREVLRAVHDVEYERSLHHYTTLKRRWETSLATAVEPFSPLSHQSIDVLFSIVSTFTSDACVGPDLLALEFYQEREVDQSHEPDVPLGEYVERLCCQVDETCIAQSCEKKMIDHHRQYVHGHGQISIYVKRYPAKLNGMEDTILMWSSCRICEEETQVVPMSGSTWKYSFAKYLELCFWSTPLHPRAGSCTHDIHRDHVRMFGFQNVAVRIQYDPINIVEVVVPRNTITWKVERDLNMKNDEYQRTEERLTAFMTSVKQRIKSIKFESINPEKVESCREEIARLTKKANDEYQYLTKTLRQKYLESKYHEIMPMNQAVRAMQEKVAEWDQAFQDFEKNFYLSERDLRKLATLQFKRIYLGIDDPIVSSEKETKSKEIEMNEMPREEEKYQLFDHESPDPVRKDFPLLAFPEAGLGVKDRPTSPILKRISIAENGPTLARLELEQKTVDQLDLAVPVLNVEVQAYSGQSGTEASTGFDSKAKPSADEPTLPVLCLHPEVAEKIEQMTNPLANGDIEEADVAQRIEQSSSNNPIHSNLVVVPPLFRAQSTPSPGDILLRSPIIKKCSEAAEAAETADVVDTAEIEAVEETQSNQVLSPLGFLKGSFQKPETATEMRIADRIGPDAFRAGKMATRSMIPRAVPRGRNETKVSALAKHFEEMTREFEKERMRERHQRAVKNRQARAYPMSSSRPIVEIFRDAHEAVREHDPSNDEVKDNVADNKSVTTFEGKGTDVEKSIHPDGDDTSQRDTVSEQAESSPKSTKYGDSVVDTGPSISSPVPDIDTILSETELPPLNDLQDSFTLSDTQDLENEEVSIEVDIPKLEKSSLRSIFKSFWYERSASGWTQLDYPLLPTDHVFVDSDVIVREDEPSSLIAFALASKDYNNKLQKSRDKLRAHDQPAQMTEDSQQLDDAAIERMLLGKTATHMKYQLQDGSAKMHCRVFYAESFDAIRQKCGVAERFVESLSRCFKWDSKGGKTKSLFLKTLDERFVIKSLSQIETQAFLKFAPDYFDYMSKSLFHGLPSAIAKMLGFYQVVIKNPETQVEISHFLQVMENIFYEGPSDRMFDLKGSMRNRRVQLTGEQNEVLLDENFLDYISQTPLYVRSHSESLLSWTVRNDTLFCSKQNVMDYSLIVGHYNDKNEILVGIIDYIRTYTWDKKLESWIKDRGKHKPTVMSPKDYRSRFRQSIPRYFPAVPSCWQLAAQQRHEQLRPTWDPAELEEEQEEEEEEKEEEKEEESIDATEDTAGEGQGEETLG